MPELVVENLSKVYPGGVKAIENISFAVDEGLYSIMGPNGSGKTTTLTICAGALKPSGGRVLVNGLNLWGGDWIEARKMLGFAPQDMPFNRKLTAIDNLVWLGLLRNMSIGESKRRAKELLEAVGLYEHRNKLVSKYSGGMLRRLTIISALIHDPDILLLDEPGSGLDPKAREEIWMYIEEFRSGRVVLFSSHDASEVERFSDKTYIFHRGRIVASGSPKELIDKYVPSKVISVWFKRGVEPPVINGVKPEVIGTIGRYNADQVSLEEVARYLEKENIPFVRVEVVEPGLDGVFIKLTGEALEV